MKGLLIGMMLVASVQVTGCVGVSVSAATLAVRSAPRDELRPLAEAGDASAQYELGKSYCCMGVGFSTQTATEWLCKAAHQGNADAMFELGRIYLGQISRTFSPGQRVRAAVMAKSYPAYAHMWLTIAATVDYPEADKLLGELEDDITATDKSRSVSLQRSWKSAPCEYDAVLAATGA